MGNENDRRDRRYDIQIPVTLKSLVGDAHLITDNVSYRGLFLRTTKSPPKMQLVRVSLTVPTQSHPIVTNVMVAYVAPVDAPVQGAGVCFFGLDGDARAEWEKFIHHVRDQQRAVAKAAQRVVTGSFARTELRAMVPN